MRYSLLILLCSLLSVALNAQAMPLDSERPAYHIVYKPSKTMVMKSLDKMGVEYSVDTDGDLLYKLNDKGWTGYVIFSFAADQTSLWNLQVRTQFATKSSYYDELLEFANHWNSTQKVPKISMKNRSKMVLTMNYPVQYGFNPQEFKVNVFNMFNRTAEKIGAEINPMRR
ncbi:MAG: YbjN domain-containing protein [Pseudomonadota bacterium]|nr:YbjN domain-containing protein [Pseudomonadota bacterium]